MRGSGGTDSVVLIAERPPAGRTQHYHRFFNWGSLEIQGRKLPFHACFGLKGQPGLAEGLELADAIVHAAATYAHRSDTEGIHQEFFRATFPDARLCDFLEINDARREGHFNEPVYEAPLGG